MSIWAENPNNHLRLNFIKVRKLHAAQVRCEAVFGVDSTPVFGDAGVDADFGCDFYAFNHSSTPAS